MAELVSIKRNVDVSPGQAAPAVFHCSQGDVGSKIILGLLNNGTAYAIPSGVTVTIEGSESNGSIFTPISATASGSDITFYLTGEMTAVAGPAICQAVLKSGSNILGTANFTLEVESSPMGADAPPVFTDAGWTWMLNKLTTEFVPALGDNIIDAIESKLDKNQGTANAGKYLKVGADGNVETADLDVTTDKTLSITDKAADAKAVGDELDDLKADLENINYGYIKLYDKNDIDLNKFYLSDGTTRTDQDMFVTNPILLPKRKTLFYDGLTKIYTSPRAVYFDSNRTFITNSAFKALSGKNRLDNIPSNAVYIAFSVDKTDLNTFTFGYDMYADIDNSMTDVKSDLADLKADISHNGIATSIDEWKNGYCMINVGSTLGEPEVSANWRYCKIGCKVGDVFYINVDTDSYTGYRAWAFADENEKILKYADKADEVHITLIAPEGATYLVLNDCALNHAWTKRSFKGTPADIKMSNNAAGISRIANNIIDLSATDSTTIRGVSFDIDKSNGNVTAKGTASDTTVFRINDRFTGVKKLLFRGCPDGGSSNTYNIAIYDLEEGTRVAYDTGSGDLVTCDVDPTRTYYVGIVVFSGVALPTEGLIFAPEVYTDGLIFDMTAETQERINAVERKASLKYMYLSGTAFICECGEHIYIDTYNFRLYDKTQKAYTQSKTDTTKLDGGYSSVRYIHFDGSKFTGNGDYNNDVIASVYGKAVTPLIDGIIADYRKIQDGYIKANSEYYINFNRMPFNALGVYDAPSYKVSERGYVYKETGTVYYNIGDRTLTFALQENTVDISNKKILMIGDSFVARGFIQNWLHNIENTIQFIGTKTTQNYNYKSEGVSGSRLYYFTNPETSPFYFNGALNFGTYLTNNNLEAPDYVVINSAINHGTYKNTEFGTYLSNLIDLVNMIKVYSASIKVYVTYGANYAVNPASIYNYPNTRYEEVRKCCNSVYDVDGITIIPVDSALIDELDYNKTDIDYLGASIEVLSDCVHPSENVGFRKIANMIYNYLGV